MLFARHISKLAPAALIAVAAATLWISQSAADETTDDFDAVMEVVENMEIEIQQHVDFGTVIRPSSDYTDFRLHWDANDVSVVGGDGDGAYIGGAQRGMFTVQPVTDDIDVTVTIEDFEEGGIDIIATHLNGDDDTDSHEFTPGQGPPPTTFEGEVGGIIRIHDDAPAGEAVSEVHVYVNSE